MRGGEMIILLYLLLLLLLWWWWWERGDDVCVTCIVGGVIPREMELPATPQAESSSTVSARYTRERGELAAVAKWRSSGMQSAVPPLNRTIHQTRLGCREEKRSSGKNGNKNIAQARAQESKYGKMMAGRARALEHSSTRALEHWQASSLRWSKCRAKIEVHRCGVMRIGRARPVPRVKRMGQPKRREDGRLVPRLLSSVHKLHTRKPRLKP